MAECTRIEPLLSAHLDGELDRGERSRVIQHLETCTTCEAEAQDMARMRSLVRSMPVRRLPDDVTLYPDRPAIPVRHRRTARAGATLAVVGGLLTGAAYSLGGQPLPDERVVTVPMDVYVADHFVHTVNQPTFMPVGIEVNP